VLLICATEAGEVLWTRVPDRVESLSLVDARRFAGAHVHPATVLDWLHGRVDDPGFDDDDPQDRALASRLRDRLNATAG
jgi:hypothetical protein